MICKHLFHYLNLHIVACDVCACACGSIYPRVIPTFVSLFSMTLF